MAVVQQTILDVADDGSPVGDGLGCTLAGVVAADGQRSFAVSGAGDWQFTGAHDQSGNYTLFVQFGASDISNFDPAVHDFQFPGSLAPGEVDFFNVPNPVAGTPFVAWIDNTATPGLDTLLAVLGQPLVAYTPEAGFKGTDQFTYTVQNTDGQVSNPATVTVTVLNRDPVASDDYASTSQETPVAIDVLANDVDPEGKVDAATLIVFAKPIHGTAVVQPTALGSTEILYTPAPGYVGTDFFFYTVRDDEGAVSRGTAVQVDVLPAEDQPPILSESVAATQENTPVAIDVLAGAYDPDLVLDPASLVITSASTRGTAVVQQTDNGPVIVYTPATGVSATLVVDNPADVDDGNYLPGHLSLREAIRLANADAYTETFRYAARDNQGVLTNEATATVTVAASPTTITFAPRLTRFGPATLKVSRVGDTSEGNSAFVISTSVTIAGPTGRRGITLAGSGSAYDLRAFLVQNNASLTLRNVDLSRWASDGDGGTIYIQSFGTADIEHATISDSFAAVDGGAIYNEGTLTITDSVLARNRARWGGALLNYRSATLTRTTLASNQALDGGGFHSGGDTYLLSPNGAGVVLTDCRLVGNKAKDRGGAFFVGAAATLQHCLVVGNTAHDGGGFANFGWLSLVNSTVTRNSAVNGGGAYNGAGNGASVSADVQVGGGGDDGTILSIQTSVISANTAVRGGGLFNVGTSAELVNSSVTGNRAILGGGIFNAVVVPLLANNPPSLNLNLTGTSVSANSAARAGGGLFNDGPVTVNGSTLTSNVAQQGGAIYNERDSLALTGSTVAGNVSGQGPQLFNHLGVLALTDSAVSDRARLQFLSHPGLAETNYVATTPGLPPWGQTPPAGTKIVSRQDGVRYALTAQGELWRQLPGSAWTVLDYGVREYKIAPSGHCFWLTDRRELYQAHPGYWGGLRAQEVPWFALDGNGTVYYSSNLPAPGNSAAYASLTAPLLDPFVEAEPSAAATPTDAEILRATGLAGAAIRNVRIVQEKIVDYSRAARFFPGVGLGQLHVVHYKVTVYYSTDFRQDALHAIYLSRNHLHRYVPGEAVASDAPSQSARQGEAEAWSSAAAPDIGSNGKIVSLTTGPDGTLYKLGGDFNGWHGGGQPPLPLPLWRLVPGGNWEPFFRVYHFAVAPDNTVWALTADHDLKRLPAGSSDWSTVDTGVQSFAMAPDGTLYALSAAGELRRLLPAASGWSTLDSGVQSFAMAPDGTLYELNGRQQLKRLDCRNKWTVLDTGVQSFAMVDGAIVELNSRGQLKRLTGRSNWALLDSDVQSFTMAPDGTVYALNNRHQLKRLTARGHWTVVGVGVRSVQVARNGDVYSLNEQRELNRLKPSQDWSTLQTGVESFTIDSDGRVYALDDQQHLTMYGSLEGYYWLGSIAAGSPPVAMDEPSQLFVLRAANIVPPSDEYFDSETDFPFSKEGAGTKSAIASSAPFTEVSSSPPLAAATPQGDVTSPVENAHNVRIFVELLADAIDPLRIFRNGGPAQLHHAYYRCTVYYTTDSDVVQQRVVYIDKDHLHMYGGAESDGTDAVNSVAPTELHTPAVQLRDDAFDTNAGIADVGAPQSSVSLWQNPIFTCDVDGNGTVTPVDVITVINELNRTGSRDLSAASEPSDQWPPYWDVSGDGWLSPADVLLVINDLNNQTSGSGVREAVADDAVSPEPPDLSSSDVLPIQRSDTALKNASAWAPTGFQVVPSAAADNRSTSAVPPTSLMCNSRLGTAGPTRSTDEPDDALADLDEILTDIAGDVLEGWDVLC
jgi:hypothetical protein